MPGQVRGTYLGQAGSEEHTLEELTHALQELVHVWPLEHVHLRAWTEGSVLLAPAAAHPAPPCPPQGAPVSPTPSHRAAPWPHLMGAACVGWGMPWPHRNVQGEVSGRLQSQVTENRLTAQTTAYPGLLETGAGHCRRAPCQDAPHIPALQRGAPTSAPQRGKCKAGTLMPPITPRCRALGWAPGPQGAGVMPPSHQAPTLLLPGA